MYKCTVIGFFGDKDGCFGGQSIKTVTITNELIKIFGTDQINKVDTNNWSKHPVSLTLKCIQAVWQSKNVIIMPAQNGLKVLATLLGIINLIVKRKFHYIVIGGWLAQFLEANRNISKVLKHFEGIYVETSTMKNDLNILGFRNVYILSNFRVLSIVNKKDLLYYEEHPYPLCTFSRVIMEKGIEDAINAVIKINEIKRKTACHLDIYGQIDIKYEQKFKELLKTSPGYINYKGIVPFNQAVEILKDYFLLLFPTRYKTEGIPGTIIDSYSAGVPIIASKWESFNDVIKEGVTGIGFEFGNFDDFIFKLEWGINNPNKINRMKPACVEKAIEYTPEYAISNLLRYLE